MSLENIVENKKSLRILNLIENSRLFDPVKQDYVLITETKVNQNCDCYSCQCDGGCDCVCQDCYCDAGPCYTD